MRIGIIGASGRMGQWFTRYFASKGNELGTYSRSQRTKIGSDEFRTFSSIQQCAEASDVILVSVPISQTEGVVSEVARNSSSGQTILEIASLKSKLVPQLKEIASKGVLVLSVHPLFGPGADIHMKQPYALISISPDESRELRRLSEIIPDSQILRVTGESHDRSMAHILSLTHFVNLAFLSSLEDKDGLLRVAGPTFKLQVSLAQAILHDEPDVLAALETENPFFEEILSDFLKHTRNIESVVRRKDTTGLAELFKRARENAQKSDSFLSSYARMYNFFGRGEEMG